MSELEARLTALEARLRQLEDERAIATLIADYGLLVDEGDADEVAALWAPDGGYQVDDYVMDGAEAIAAMVASAPHQHLIDGGCAHFQGPARIVVDGDRALAHGYSLLIRHRDGQFVVARTTANRWELERTELGWRVRQRASHLVQGRSPRTG